MASINDIAKTQLRVLCDSLAMRDEYPEAFLLQRFLFERWGEREIGRRPEAPSLVSDDQAPYELSAWFGADHAELRLLFEAQPDIPGLLAKQRAARALTTRLAQIYPINTSRLDAVSDLFLPQAPQGQFSYWHSVSFTRGGKPELAAILNPQIAGRDKADAVVSEALVRLGLAGAARALRERLGWRGEGLDELVYFSIDLADRTHPRVHVYFAHHGATAADLEDTCGYAPMHRDGDVDDFCTRMVASGGTFSSKPVITCFTFVQSCDTPTAYAVHLPIAFYARTDDAIRMRVSSYLRDQGIEYEPYANLMARFTARPLANGLGTHSYASIRRDHDQLHVGVSLSPELYRGYKADSCPTSFRQKAEATWGMAR